MEGRVVLFFVKFGLLFVMVVVVAVAAAAGTCHLFTPWALTVLTRLQYSVENKTESDHTTTFSKESKMPTDFFVRFLMLA